MGVLEGRALYEGGCYSVHTRIAECDGAIYIDLCNDEWEAVKISREGWEVVSRPPVRFRRAPGMETLPYPERGGDLNEMRKILSIESDVNWQLLVGFMIGCLKPSGPYFVLGVYGEHGSAKTTLCRVVRRSIDPNRSPMRSGPKNVQDLMIAARNGWVLAYDNISYVKPELSDSLCRLSTGGGFGTRKLYSDDEESLFEAQRPVLINGITEVITRSDLLDRSIVLYLPTIPKKKRKSEKEIWRMFELARPKFLGVLLDAVVSAIKNEHDIHLDELPRMADPVIWITAAEASLGWTQGTFARAYQQNRKAVNDFALEASPVATAILRLLEQAPWSGTADQLLQRLGQLVPQDVRISRGWPKMPHNLSRTLRRIAPNLRADGVEIEFSQTGGSRSRKIISLFRPALESSDATDASDAMSPESPSNADRGVASVAGVAIGPRETVEL
jgi:hypothetical protein